MPSGLQTLADIRTQKTRTSELVSGYLVTAIAKSVRIKTTEIGWAIYRTNINTGDVDWAKDTSGYPTDEYVFDAVNIHLKDFTE